MLKIGLFIDIANQVDGVPNGSRVNYKNLLELFVEHRLWKNKAYGFYLTEEGIAFIQALQIMGYESSFLKVKPNEEIPNRVPEIMLDIIDSYSKLDIVAIGSNSREFLPLIEWLRNRSVRVWIVAAGLRHKAGDLNIDLLDEVGIVEELQPKVISDGTRTGSS